MSRKANIDPQIEGFYFAESGDDAFSGESFELPKRTVQEAINAAAALSPDLFNPALVSAAQGGSFNEGFFLPGFINFEAMSAQFITAQSVSITLGDAQICSIFGVRNGSNNSTCFLIDGKSLAGTRSLFCAVSGNDSIGYEITGLTNGVFITCDRLTVGGDRSIGIKITGTFLEPIDVDMDTILLNGDDSVFVDYNPTNPADTCVIDISTVFSSGATVFSSGSSSTTVYIVRAGHLTIQGAVLIAETAIEVKSGAEADLRQETVIGNIIVDSGGVLNVDILDHKFGTITNNGTINGIINGVPFGTYQQKHEEQLVLSASDFTQQDPTGTDAPMQIKFGGAQFGSSDPVEIDALGNITINQSDQYNMRAIFEFGRVGAGAFSLLLFRILINGTQSGNSQYAKVSTSDTVTPIEFSAPLDLVATDVVTVEMIRDSSGFDAGSIFPVTPVLGTVNQAPSAFITLRRNRLVQPVNP